MGALESQLEEAARQLGAEIVQEQSSMPAADVIEVNTQSEPEQPVAEEPSQEPLQQEYNSQPLPGEDVLNIQTEQTVEPASSLNTETQTENSSEESDDDYDVEEAVSQYLSERLGMQINSIDELSSLFTKEEPQQVAIDERIKVIADFVEQTGRSPEDWFLYQSINADEMSDLEAVRSQLQTQYQNLSVEEVDLLISNKYKLDDSIYSDEEVKYSTLQLKIDAADAKKKITELKNNFLAPAYEPSTASNESFESPINENWISSMTSDAESLEAITFELGDSEFNFGISDDYRKSMVQKNANIENFFDDYVYEDGSWDFEKLNMHRAVLDNIDSIVQSVYKQGLSDGQRNLVDKAANVDISSPKVNPQSVDSEREFINDLVEKLRPDNRLRLYGK